MTDRIRRKSASRIAVRIAVTLAILLVATLVSQQLSEINAVTSNASQPVQYGYVAYSGQDIWQALPTGR